MIDNYWIYHTSYLEEDGEEYEKNTEDKLWKIAKYCKSKNKQIDGYKLTKNDVIKVGRVRFRVKEIQSPAYRKLALKIEEK